MDNIRTYDVRAFGADSRDLVSSARAFSEAVARCAAEGGGEVLIPAGSWRVEELRLADRVVLRLAAGARVDGTVVIEDAEAAGVVGEDPKRTFITAVRCTRSRGLRLEGYGGRGTSFHCCDDGVIRRLSLHQEIQRQGEGSVIWCWGCNDLDFSDCDLSCNDDVFCIKGNGRNIHIRRSVLSGRLAAAYKIGTETGGPIEHVSFTDSVVVNSDRAALSLEAVDGTQLRNVLVARVRMINVTAPIFIRLGNRDRFNNGIGSISDVTLSDIDSSGMDLCDAFGSSITGLPGHPVENVRIANVRLAYRGGMGREWASRAVPELPNTYPEYDIFGVLPAWGLWCRHVRGLEMRNVTMRTARPDLRPAVMLEDVHESDMEGLDAVAWPGSRDSLTRDGGTAHYRYPDEQPAAEPAVEMRSVTRVFMHGCAAPYGVALARVRGSATDQVALRENRAMAGLPVVLEAGEEVRGAVTADEDVTVSRIARWEAPVALDDTVIPDDRRPGRAWIEGGGARRECASIIEAVKQVREGEAIVVDGCHRLSAGEFPLVIEKARVTMRSADAQNPARLMAVGAAEEMVSYSNRDKRRQTLARGALVVLAADGVVVENLALSGALFNVLATGVKGCAVRNNRFEFGKRWHMYFVDCRDFEVVGNYTQACLNCFCTMEDCHGFVIRGHVSRHDPAGLRLSHCTNNTIEECWFHAISWDAVLLGDECRKNRVAGNQFLGGRLTGLQLRGAHDNVVERNVFRGHRTEAVLVDRGATGNRIHHNVFEGNRSFGVSNETSGEVDARHNWWGSADGPCTAERRGPGDMVDARVVYEPFLRERPAHGEGGCG